MAQLEVDESLTVTEKESKIRAAFDAARKDIAVIQAKKDVKKEEMAMMETEVAPAAAEIPPSSGAVLNNTHPSES